MKRTTLAILLIVVLAVAGVAAAVAFGVGPAPGGGGTGDDIENFPTETPSDGSDGGNETDDGSASAPASPFTFAIDDIENCGTTCRDVTVTLFNEQDHSASDVTVFTRIYVGNSTAEDDVIWEGTEAVGTMAANASATRTQRVSLSYSEAYAVQQADGWITVVTTVQSANETVTFERHRDVT